MANVIYRGPVEREPQTLNLPVAGAYSPGILVTEDGTNLTLATSSDTDKEILVLSNRRLSGQDVATAYASGDTGVAYRIQAGDLFQCRVAAATYAKGDALTMGDSGYLEAAASGERVLAYYEGTVGTIAAGTLEDVRMANSFAAA